MRLKKRRLNSHEKYACNTKDVKNIFGNESDNVSISFGFLSRFHSFDSSDRKKPKIEGIVIASASINFRDKVPDLYRTYIICFYVISDLGYDAKNQETFTELYLPLLYQWYQEMLARPETSLPGVENILIEWSRNIFKVHRYRES